jgi:hypothetical protein
MKGISVPPRIAICFYGITRSLRHTLPSIEARAIGPARAAGEARIYGHFFLQRRIDNPRTGERGELDPEEHRLLRPDWVELEEPDLCLAQWDFEGLKRHGDFWDDGFHSLRNLIHQLHSLNRVTAAARADGARICLFLRPDLEYHDSLGPAIRRAQRALRTTRPLVQLPWWQGWNGYNDRFAIAAGDAAIAAYGTRVTQMAAFCDETGGPVHSERLLAHVLERNGIPVRTIGARASRVRIEGRMRYEDFLPTRLSNLRRGLRERLSSRSPDKTTS